MRQTLNLDSAQVWSQAGPSSCPASDSACRGAAQRLRRQPSAARYREPLQTPVLLKPYNGFQFTSRRRQHLSPRLNHLCRTCCLLIPPTLSLRMLSPTTFTPFLSHAPSLPGTFATLFLLPGNTCHSFTGLL